MTTDLASEESAAGSDSSAERPAEGRERTAAPRSFWRVSLGGVLLFAAGAMVGFAPMRAWLFFRDDPKQVLIETIVFSVQESENDKVRQAFSTDEANDLARDIHPTAVLASRIRSHSIYSQPTLTTIVDEPIVLSFGTNLAPATQADGSVIFLPAGGVHMRFLPKVRPGGKLQLNFETKYSHAPATGGNAAATPTFDEVSVESAVAVEEGEWRLVEMNVPTEEYAAAKRTRWMLLRMKPVKP